MLIKSTGKLLTISIILFFSISPLTQALEVERVDYNFAWLYPNGKKIGWTCDGKMTTDTGPHTYAIRIIIDVALIYMYTVTSKALFTGNYIVNITPSSNVVGPVVSSFFPTPQIFEPSYEYGKDVPYFDTLYIWINFTQTDTVNISIPIEYKMYITDLNRDDKIDDDDATIISNEFGKSWSLPVDPNDYTWRADINTDGIVDIYDAILLRNSYGKPYIASWSENVGLLNIWEPVWSKTC